METLIQMMQRAGRRFSGLGKRQKVEMKKCCKNIPTTPLEVEYKNGIKIQYRPVGVEGQFLVCHATEQSPIAPNEVNHSGIAVSIWEFTDDPSKKLFRKYHEALSSKCALMWDDGTPVSTRDILGEKTTQGELPVPKKAKEVSERMSNLPNI
jgi:hypothetical protein